MNLPMPTIGSKCAVVPCHSSLRKPANSPPASFMLTSATPGAQNRYSSRLTVSTRRVQMAGRAIFWKPFKYCRTDRNFDSVIQGKLTFKWLANVNKCPADNLSCRGMIKVHCGSQCLSSFSHVPLISISKPRLSLQQRHHSHRGTRLLLPLHCGGGRESHQEVGAGGRAVEGEPVMLTGRRQQADFSGLSWQI